MRASSLKSPVNKIVTATLLIVLLAFVTACVSTSTVSAVNVAQPVLLGKVQRLNSKSSGPLGLK